jgi:single-strand DNA-binding protein
VKYLPDGTCVANISVATTESYKDKTSGDKVEKTEWHRVSFFGKLGEIVAKYLIKGSLVYVEGRLATRKWTDKENVERYVTEIKADQMQMLGGKSEGAAPARSTAPAAAQRPAAARPAQDMDLDIPF